MYFLHLKYNLFIDNKLLQILYYIIQNKTKQNKQGLNPRIMTDKTMHQNESITLSDHNTGDKPPAPSVCNIMEGDSGVDSTGCCTMVSTIIPPNSGAGYTGC